MHTCNRTLLLALGLLAATPAYASRDLGTRMMEAFPESAPDAAIYQDADFKSVNWAQPPVGCVEEMVPHRADSAAHPCPDLSQVANPSKDWPANISPSEMKYWYAQRRGINICRSEEVLRREKAVPGSQSASLVELSWMAEDSLRNQTAKVQAVYDASRATGVPLQVLTGAVYQESLFSELGVADDGGNYSCGVEQINLIGWCEWMNKQGAADKKAMNWPQQTIACNDPNLITLSFFKPVYEIAKTRLNGLPEYRLVKEHFQNIPLASFVSQWPAATADVQALRYQLIMSYINNCSEPRKGILAKANELTAIYNQFVSPALKAKDRYAGSDHFNRTCREVQSGNAYPLNTGWLMAVSAYNAGPRSFDALAHYNKWSKDDMNDPRVLANLTPNDIVTSLYWAGRYNPSNDLIEFNGLGGGIKNWTWFKGCVAQRHIARVMQHVTLLPDFFVDTLEGNFPCARSTFDATGKLVQTAVPPFRQTSPGVKAQ
ncbi:MAG: hypothetical protein ACXVB9_11230 [Bdellovibrionota bacterium]